MAKQHLPDGIRNYLLDRHSQDLAPASADEITTQLGEKRSTVNRYLASLAQAGLIQKLGNGPATRYRIPGPVIHQVSAVASAVATATATAAIALPWSAQGLVLRAQL